jgi:hypothetical protein
MTLGNLVKTGQLKAHTATAAEIQRLLAAAERNVADARQRGISNETRFDCGYKAIMQCALVAMLASGYRPSTNAPGHHQTMIQSLPLTLGLSNDEWLMLDALRKKRNLSDYLGIELEDGARDECIDQAKSLIARVRGVLDRGRPDLLKPLAGPAA